MTDKHLVTPKFDEIDDIDDIDDKVIAPTFITNLLGMFQTISSVPTAPPTRLINQIQIYTNGSTYRLYWYDTTNQTWHYVTATA